jgi:surface polysaccharide O-acyltransferase-like enzyme
LGAGGLFVDASWLAMFIGYFVLGAYLRNIRLRSSITLVMWLLSSLWTVVGTWLVSIGAGGHVDEVFRVYVSANVILASSALFLLLYRRSTNQLRKRLPRTHNLLCFASQNSLPIYLFHVMLLEGFQKGLFGFQLSVTTLNPILEIPLVSLLTLTICLGVIWLLKKIPILSNAIG